MDSTKIKIHKMLRPFGVARKYVGMPMLVRAVEIAIAHPTSVNAVQKEIYSVIAAENGARWKTIESSIRRYLTVAWENNPAYMKLLAGSRPRQAKAAIRATVQRPFPLCAGIYGAKALPGVQGLAGS